MKKKFVQSRTEKRQTMLAILDGWGISDQDYGNAVRAANTPNLDRLFADHPHTRIAASGLAVGLPEGQMGNSEVGHLNIGAGRTVYQSLTRISKDIADGTFFENPVLIAAVENAKPRATTEFSQPALHLMGLVGPGGVHSHGEHLVALLELAAAHGVRNVCIHAFLDGRDTPPRSAEGFLAELEASVAGAGVGRIATICGRYYAMDRDKRWERVQQAYDALTLGDGRTAASVAEAIQTAYANGENDEFVIPTNIIANAAHVAAAGFTAATNSETTTAADFADAQGLISEPVTIRDGDSVIFFNFRPDRARELTRCFVDPDFDGFVREKIPQIPLFVTMTEYDATLPNVRVAYPPENIENTLGEYISKLGLRQLRIAETEKYAHVTFFFNGQVEPPYAGEERILVPSPKIATYDLMPEMSANIVTEQLIGAIHSGNFDLIILNFANMDMVGHTGVMEAAVKAVEAIDACVGKIVAAIQDCDGQLLITADHGNSECMLTGDGRPVTAHTCNPVPLILLRADDANFALTEGGALSDLAPTLLDMMELPIPAEMTGHSLLRRN